MAIARSIVLMSVSPRAAKYASAVPVSSSVGGTRRSVAGAGKGTPGRPLPRRPRSIGRGQPLLPLRTLIGRLAVPSRRVLVLLPPGAGDAPARRLGREKELLA